MKRSLLLLTISLFSLAAGAQTGIIRGNVYDEETGEPIIYGTVRLLDTEIGTNTDFDGFFSLGDLEPGNYTLVTSYTGYGADTIDVQLDAGEIVYETIFLKTAAVQLATVDVSSQREQARSDVQVSKLTVTSEQIKALPATGGEPDIAQYLPVLPGIIVSGDQGGQLYIRGGSPVQNRIMLDGMTIYNPFHSIGFFSVFETETIRNVDVLTGGFNAQHGGRISAIVDIKTREGNKKRFSGLVSASPFQAKALVEGPIKKLNPETGGSSSFILTAKHSYLDESSKIFYDYATDTSFFSFATGDTTLADVLDEIGLPYQYTDLYAKISLLAGNGSKLDLFGINYNDRFDFLGIANLNWNTIGGGANFTLVPPNSNVVIDGTVALTSYDVQLTEADGRPRSSAINNFNALLNFSYFGYRNSVQYGFEFNGFNTDFQFANPVGLQFEQKDFTTEIAGYIKYKQKVGDLILEPGFRLQYYASQSTASFEPRFGLKYAFSDNVRFKAAGGFYSQNLISTVNELDVVNFFVGFLAGPEEELLQPGSDEPTNHRIQKASHIVGGLEIDVSDQVSINIEPYYKRFNQLIQINRNKIDPQDPDFQVETGNAYGIDFSLRYQTPRTYFWMTYSLARVDRDDGEQVYPTIFDRRHNVNLLLTHAFGKDRSWEASARWNYGSAFPFTQTQGFYEEVPFSDLILTDVLTGNFNLGTILDGDRNAGRLSDYHRLDLSLKKTIEFSRYTGLDITVSVTNAYNRENIFYVDRITNTRVNQLPILPSLAAAFRF